MDVNVDSEMFARAVLADIQKLQKNQPHRGWSWQIRIWRLEVRWRKA